MHFSDVKYLCNTYVVVVAGVKREKKRAHDNDARITYVAHACITYSFTYIYSSSACHL